MAAPPLAAGSDVDPSSAIRLTVSRFPQNAAARDAVGLPLGAVVRPFAPLAAPGSDAPHADALPRCGDCAAYISGFCQMERDGWICALCGRFTRFDAASRERYRRTARRGDLPELASSAYECVVASQTVHCSAATPFGARPVVVALVDAACDASFLEAVRAALLAALLAAGPATLFGLATYARRVALWDVQGAAPAVRLVPLAPDVAATADAPCALELADALPLEAFLAPLDTWRDEAEAALEALRADERGSSAPRAFGAALDALLTMLGAPGGVAPPLGAPPPPAFPAVRVLAFLSGPPNAGVGTLDAARWDEVDPSALAAAPSAPAAEAALAAADALARPQTDFYTEAGARAAAGNIVVDVFALPPAGGRACLDLASLAPLPRACGGALFHYPNGPGDAPLARDVHRLLSQPTALFATLRLRTSPELRAVRAHGHVAADAAFEGVFHMTTCGPHDCVSFDLDYASAEGFSAPSSVEQPPALQLAFEYTTLMPLQEGAEGEVGSAGSFVRQRRRRVVTQPARVARSRRHGFESCDAEAAVALLTHKALRAVATEGLAEARAMVSDWLGALVARASEAYPSGPGATPDATLGGACPPLASLPRAAFGLLRGPLLRGGAHPDARSHAAHLAATLSPASLATLLYPRAAPWQDPETPIDDAEGLPLARAALREASAPVVVLDALTDVVVYVAPPPPGAPPALPLPPRSALQLQLNALREARPCTPRVQYILAGTGGEAALEELLLEDGGGGEPTFDAFLDAVSVAAQEMIGLE